MAGCVQGTHRWQFKDVPSRSTVSSVAKPGGSVAISNNTPPGSRKVNGIEILTVDDRSDVIFEFPEGVPPLHLLGICCRSWRRRRSSERRFLSRRIWCEISASFRCSLQAGCETPSFRAIRLSNSRRFWRVEERMFRCSGIAADMNWTKTI